jgi:predicted nucleic acid-binding protein
MILLDTNIVSEPLRARPDPRIRAWLDAADQQSLFLCTPVLAEIRFGIERLPSSARRARLDKWCVNLEEDIFVDRILSFDRSAAHEFGRIIALRQRLRRIIKPLDAQIAAIAAANGLALATRDVEDFAGLGFEVINPFANAPPSLT